VILGTPVAAQIIGYGVGTAVGAVVCVGALKAFLRVATAGTRTYPSPGYQSAKALVATVGVGGSAFPPGRRARRQWPRCLVPS